MRTVVVFDFDGTLTSKDSMLEFIAFSKGRLQLYLGLLIFLPQLVLMKCGILSNHAVKERFLSFYFKGMAYADFKDLGEHFIERVLRIQRPDTIRDLNELLSNQATAYVVTASIEEWVRPYCLTRGIKAENVLGTQLEVDDDGRLTGRFATPNCNDEEKVTRFLAAEPDRQNYRLIAYGDSKGDIPMFRLADEYMKV